MELSFKTSKYKTKVTKNATIHCNDLVNPQMKIYVEATVDPAPDSTLPFTFSPEKVILNQKSREFEVVVNNVSDQRLKMSPKGVQVENLEMKIKDYEMNPGKRSTIRFKWKGEFQKENLERSLTFDLSGSRNDRFTIPVVVQGTNPTPYQQPAKKQPVPKVAPKSSKGGSGDR